MITLAHLLVRRRVVEASRRRHRPRTMPAARPPAGIVTAYTSALLDVSRELDRALGEELSREGIPVRMDAQGEVPPPTPNQAERIRRRLEQLAERIVGRRSLLVTLEDLAQRTSDWSRAEWSRQVKATLGVDLTGDLDLRRQLEAFRVENVRLIKSLAGDKVQRVHQVLAEAGAGTRVEQIAERISAETGATASRAALIARDQVLSLNAQVTQARHVAAGVTEYVWRSSRDERVRKRHRELDGTRQKYSEPPIVDERTGRRAHAGQDFGGCRCVAEPTIPGFDE